MQAFLPTMSNIEGKKRQKTKAFAGGGDGLLGQKVVH
jgi:hypothetical protein